MKDQPAALREAQATLEALQKEEEAMIKSLSTKWEALQLAILRGFHRLRASGDTGDVPAIIWMIGVAVAVAAVVLVVVAVLNAKAGLLTSL